MPEKINEGMTLVAIADVRMDPSNVRAHGERNIETIKGSLSRFGQQKPIVIDRDGVVVAGNGTLEAARSLGWERIGVVYSDLVGSDRTGYAIADNRTAELAEWDTDALSSQLNALRMDEDFDLLATGFTDDDLEKMGFFGVDSGEMPELPDGDKAPFQQMTFTLHDDQAQVVKRAIEAAKKAGSFIDSPNENSNGNALARIAEAYIGQG